MLDTISGKYSIQNPLKSHKKSTNIQNHCGIHSISINPSRTLLATGAEHVNDIAVYSLPSMEPVSVGYGAHSYWIFDILWLDDEHVCSGKKGKSKYLINAFYILNSNNIYHK
jgi:WD repeat-containing protein 40A